jgi:hypothetical protein
MTFLEYKTQTGREEGKLDNDYHELRIGKGVFGPLG